MSNVPDFGNCRQTSSGKGLGQWLAQNIKDTLGKEKEMKRTAAAAEKGPKSLVGNSTETPPIQTATSTAVPVQAASTPAAAVAPKILPEGVTDYGEH